VAFCAPSRRSKIRAVISPNGAQENSKEQSFLSHLEGRDYGLKRQCHLCHAPNECFSADLLASMATQNSIKN
jgi:hypothetical protein